MTKKTHSLPGAVFEIPQRQAILDWLQHQVPSSRVKHILRVETLAADLAQCHGVDATKAAQAGLLHDLAKYFSPERLLKIAEKENMPLDAVDRANPHLLHAPVSAIVARQEFGVEDPEVLAAIAHHTLGSPAMSPLSCVVFLADSLEPGRGHHPDLELLRHQARRDLHTAVWQTCDRTLRQVLKKEGLIHPRTVATRNWAIHQARNRLP